MNIIFLTLKDLSNINNRGIYPDLLRKFRDEGHDVYVIHPLERRKKRKTVLEKKSGITFLRVRTLNIQGTNIIEKGISTILLENLFLREFKRKLSNITFDLVLYSTPPVTLTNVVKYIKGKNNAVAYLLLKDIFPQNAVDIGMLRKNSFLHRFFLKKEKELYQCSDFIGCMSQANVDYILKNNTQLNPSKIEVNPNTISPIANKSGTEEKLKLREKYKVPSSATVFIYGGNIGKPQGVEFIMEVLHSQSANNDAYFIIVGEGTDYLAIDKWVKEKRPENVVLFSYLPSAEYDELLRLADVGLIFLDKRFTIPNFPSRILSYLENKMPVLAATDKNTDFGKVIESSECGLWSESGDLPGFNVHLNSFVKDRELVSRMGENGYQLLMNNYTVDVSYNAIVTKIAR